MNTVAESATAALAFAIASISIPPLGARLEGQGGSFEALMKGENGQPDYLLILHDEHSENANWKDQTAWAAGLETDGHKDFTLPNRRELNAMRANARDKFNDDWYWSCEPTGSDYAWSQHFYYGYQYSNPQHSYTRACAVRRVPIR